MRFTHRYPGQTGFYSGRLTRAGRRRQRRIWEDEQILIKKLKDKKKRRALAEGSGGVSSLVTPVMIVQGLNQIGQRFFEMSGMPEGVLGKFTGEVVHTLGGTWIWTGFSWESYIYPG